MVGESPAAIPSRQVSDGGFSASVQVSARAPRSARAATHSGHHGAARPDSGSRTSSAEPCRIARINSLQEDRAVRLGQLIGEITGNDDRWGLRQAEAGHPAARDGRVEAAARVGRPRLGDRPRVDVHTLDAAGAGSGGGRHPDRAGPAAEVDHQSRRRPRPRHSCSARAHGASPGSAEGRSRARTPPVCPRCRARGLPESRSVAARRRRMTTPAAPAPPPRTSTARDAALPAMSSIHPARPSCHSAVGLLLSAFRVGGFVSQDT